MGFKNQQTSLGGTTLHQFLYSITFNLHVSLLFTPIFVYYFLCFPVFFRSCEGTTSIEQISGLAPANASPAPAAPRDTAISCSINRWWFNTIYVRKWFCNMFTSITLLLKSLNCRQHAILHHEFGDGVFLKVNASFLVWLCDCRCFVLCQMRYLVQRPTQGLLEWGSSETKASKTLKQTLAFFWPLQV